MLLGSTDGRLFNSETDGDYLLSRKLEICEVAFGFSGRVGVVHHYQAGYEILFRDITVRGLADGVFATYVPPIFSIECALIALGD